MSKIILPAGSPITTVLRELAHTAKVIILAGLPGVGKSLYVQQAALMAQEAGRDVHLLQWDVTRSAFETPDILARYPEIDGVTHAMIRKAVGLWTRQGLLDWSQTHRDDAQVLVGEAPLVGERLMQLAKVYDDDAETLLASPRTQFVLPVPSVRVREMIESRRAHSIASPQHENERNDAPPNVLTLMWQEIYHVGHVIGVARAAAANPTYDADVYRRTYEHLLRHRHRTTLEIDEVFEPAGSVYELEAIAGHLKATPEQVEAIMKMIESRESVADVQAEVDRWYV